MSTDDIVRASRLLDNEVLVLKDELQRTNLDLETFKENIKENQEKIKLNKQLPYLVGNIVEILEMNPEDEAEEDGANIDLDSQRKGKRVVLKTSTRQGKERKRNNLFSCIYSGLMHMGRVRRNEPGYPL